MCNDGLIEAQVSRIIKTLQITTTIINCFGFSLLIIKAFFFANNQNFHQILNQTFTCLILIEIILNLSIKYWMSKARKTDENCSNTKNIFDQIKGIFYGIIQSFKNIWDLLHFILIFLQPNIFLSQEVNNRIYNIAPIRVYTFIRFSLLMMFLLDPRFMRITKFFKKSKPILALKVAYKKYFIISIISFIMVIVIGFGNLMKDEEIQIFEDIYVASYFIFVTISTVGYGDYIPTNLIPRLVCVFILICGVFIMSLLTFVFMNQTKLNDRQYAQYCLLKNLKNKQEVKRFIAERFVYLIDQSLKKQKIKQEQNNKIIISKCQNLTNKTGNLQLQKSTNSSKINILQQSNQIMNNFQQTSQQKTILNADLLNRLQELAHQIHHSQAAPFQMLTSQRKLARIKMKMLPLLLTNMQFMDITKPKIANQIGHRSFVANPF